MPQGAGGQKKKKKGRAPAHQNAYAFRHNPKSKLTDKILSSPNVGCCQRCHDKIEWRKKYRKYKPLTQPGKCNLCQRRNVKAAYHTICSDCAVSDRAHASAPAAASASSAAAAPAGGAKGNDANVGTVSPTGGEVVEDDPTTSPATKSEPGRGDKHRPHPPGSAEDRGPPRKQPRRRMCAVCVRDFAIGGSSEDDSATAAMLEEELAGETGRVLKLRERRALERKVERAQREAAPRNDDRSGAGDVEAGEKEEDDEDCGRDDERAANGREEGSSDEAEVLKGLDDGDDEEDDPFLKAVGGSDKLLTGEAYQKALLEKNV